MSEVSHDKDYKQVGKNVPRGNEPETNRPEDES